MNKYKFLDGLMTSQGLNFVVNSAELENFDQIDYEFRKNLGNPILQDSLRKYISQLNVNNLYFYTDEFGFHYLFFKLENGEVLSVGPYKIEILITDKNYKGYEQAAFEDISDPFLKDYVKKFYQSLPDLRTGNRLIKQYTILLEYVFSLSEVPLEINSYHIDTEELSVGWTPFSFQSLKMIEERYADEDEFMLEVEKGNTNALLSWNWDRNAKSSHLVGSMQAARDSLLILSTLCRKAVQRANVHPYYINEVSAYVYRKISSVTIFEEGNDVAHEMIVLYTDLVKKHSLRGYSPIIISAINYIDFNLSTVNSLSDVADAITVNASYLSTRFKREVHKTVTDYIHSKKISMAQYYLRNSKDSISSIAEKVGYQDDNYFYKMFKKHTNLTPSEYRARL